MIKKLLVGLVAIVAVGAAIMIGMNSTDSGPSPITRDQIASDFFAKWKLPDSALPDRQQIQFFNQYLTEQKSGLIDSLKNTNENARKSAAYVIANLGDKTDALQTEVMNMLKSEESQAVRIYLVDAAGSIAQSSDSVKEYLIELFGESEVEKEKLHMSAFLYTACDEEKKAEYEDYFCRHLTSQPEGDLTAEEWTALQKEAVQLAEKMKGSEKTIMHLEAMMVQDETVPWMRTYVPMALKKLKPVDDSIAQNQIPERSAVPTPGNRDPH